MTMVTRIGLPPRSPREAWRQLEYANIPGGIARSVMRVAYNPPLADGKYTAETFIHERECKEVER